MPPIDILADSKHVSGKWCVCESCLKTKQLATSWRAQWKQCVQSLWPRWRHPEFKVLYHGTNIANARQIWTNGVSLPQERHTQSQGQFSYHGAFYLTDQADAAAEFAQSAFKEPQVVVLTFLFYKAGQRIHQYIQPTDHEFWSYFVFSMTNMGRDVTSVLDPSILTQLKLTRHKAQGSSRRPMNIHELRWKAAQLVKDNDMITGPMLRNRQTWQYAITSRRGLNALQLREWQIYDGTTLKSVARSSLVSGKQTNRNQKKLLIRGN
ncbi:hypothetical protein C8R45DRAFT_1019146 [Mycena sanguinolenta]|nr:hypothetical protein C8R45DRAFT_1019146 [Mycena sanguinolenta]